MTGRLTGRVAVITGGTRGLGLAIAIAYGREGARAVVVASRSGSSVAAAVARLRSEGIEAAGVAVDVSVQADVAALRDLAISQYGTIDVWVNNAGSSASYGPAHLVATDAFLATTDTVIRGTYFGTLAALDVMEPHGAGHVVNLLGRGDKQPVPLQAAYGSAKAWVRAFTLAVAKEHKASGVHIHAFNPGLVLTEMLGEVSAVRGFEAQLSRLPVIAGMWGRTPEDAARPAVELVCGTTTEHQALGVGRVMTRTAAYGLARLLGRAPALPPMNVTTVEPRSAGQA